MFQMVLMEESGDKPTLVIDRDPEGVNEIVEQSRILEASHVREVSDIMNHLRTQASPQAWREKLASAGVKCNRTLNKLPGDFMPF